MQCKHKNCHFAQTFWSLFDECLKEVNNTTNKYLPKSLPSDMAVANCNGLVLICREDVLQEVNGCEFHFSQSVEKNIFQVKKGRV